MNHESDLIDAMLYEAAQHAGAQASELPMEPSVRFLRRMKRLLKRASYEEEWAEWLPAFRRMKRLAALMAAAAALCLIFTLEITPVAVKDFNIFPKNLYQVTVASLPRIWY